MFWYDVRPPEFVAIASSSSVSARNNATLISSARVGRSLTPTSPLRLSDGIRLNARPAPPSAR
jgi:hypothetical protein